MQIKRTKISLGGSGFDGIIAILMILFCISILYPVWDMLVMSFSASDATSALNFNMWPKKFSLDAYRYCLSEDRLLTAFLVSLYRTTAGTVLHIIVVAFAAYPLSKLDIPFRKIYIIYFLIPMFFSGGMIPRFITYKNIGLIDNLLVYILPSAFSPFVMLIMRNFFISLDKAVEESAVIDGASVLTIMFRIVFPLSKPILATVALWQMVGQWNAWFDSMIYIRDERKIVMQLLLKRIMDQTDLLTNDMQMYVMTQPNAIQFTTQTVKAAITVIVVLPIVCVYPFLQKYFVKGIMLGSVKG